MSRSAARGSLVVEAVEWLPSAADAGLLRVRGRRPDPSLAGTALPELCIGARRFRSLPDARFGRDPYVWRAGFLVPPDLLAAGAEPPRLAWPGGEETPLPRPELPVARTPAAAGAAGSPGDFTRAAPVAGGDLAPPPAGEGPTAG